MTTPTMDDLSRAEYPAMLVSLVFLSRVLGKAILTIDSAVGQPPAQPSSTNILGPGQADRKSQPGNCGLASGTNAPTAREQPATDRTTKLNKQTTGTQES